jgi:GR25 family glycosyltransferase involved in LPS biosynthesis
MSTGTLGCALAHFSLWSDVAAKQDHLRHILADVDQEAPSQGVGVDKEHYMDARCESARTQLEKLEQEYILVLEDDVILSPHAIHRFHAYVQVRPRLLYLTLNPITQLKTLNPESETVRPKPSTRNPRVCNLILVTAKWNVQTRHVKGSLVFWDRVATTGVRVCEYAANGGL